MLNVNFEKMVKLYLYQEIDNWKWTYNELVELLTDEFDYEEAKEILIDSDSNLSDVQALDKFELLVKEEIRNHFSLNTFATEEKNNAIMNSLKPELNDILR